MGYWSVCRAERTTFANASCIHLILIVSKQFVIYRVSKNNLHKLALGLQCHQPWIARYTLGTLGRGLPSRSLRKPSPTMVPLGMCGLPATPLALHSWSLKI